MRGAHQTAWIMQAIRHEKQKVFLQTSDRKLESFLSDWKNSEHLHAFPYPNIEDSTFHHPPLSPKRETYGMLLFVQLSHSYLLHRGKSATCYRYCQALTYSILFSTFFHRRIFRLSWRFPWDSPSQKSEKNMFGSGYSSAISQYMREQITR